MSLAFFSAGMDMRDRRRLVLRMPSIRGCENAGLDVEQSMYFRSIENKGFRNALVCMGPKTLSAKNKSLYGNKNQQLFLSTSNVSGLYWRAFTSFFRYTLYIFIEIFISQLLFF